MKTLKRAISVFLCLILIVGTMLTDVGGQYNVAHATGTLEETTLSSVKKEELNSFLRRFCRLYADAFVGAFVYDLENGDEYDCDKLSNSPLLASLLNYGAYQFYYDTDSRTFDRTEYSEYQGYEPGTIPSDPQKIYKEQYTKTKADEVDWVAKNIFNCSDKMIAQMRINGDNACKKYGDKRLEYSQVSERFYYDSGYYYCNSTSGIGDPSYPVSEIRKVLTDGEFYYVQYRYWVAIDTIDAHIVSCLSYNYAKLQYKKLNGKNYWTIFKNSTKKFWDEEGASVLYTGDPKELWNPSYVLFSKDSTEYDQELAYVAAYLSEQAEIGSDGDKHTGEIKMKKAYEYLGFKEEDIKLNYQEDELCFGIACSKEDNLLVITCRGTNSPGGGFADALCSADKTFWEYNAYAFPYEFYNKVMSDLDSFVSTRQYLKNSNLKVLITGHSLGGAAANLIAACMIRISKEKNINTWYKNTLSHRNIYCYTFGSIGSINDLDKNGKDLLLPVRDGYPNIHNVMNKYDTFSFFDENYCGGYPLIFNHIGVAFQKFGKLYTFEKKIKGDALWNTVNHNMSTYLEAVYNGVVAEDTKSYYSFREKDDINGVAQCPVDIEIYKNGELVGRTLNNVVDESVTKVNLKTMGDVKLFNLSNGSDYSIVLRAFDRGQMKYSLFYDTESGETISHSFDNVELTSGKTMKSDIDRGVATSDVKLYVTDSSGNKIAEINSDGIETQIEEQTEEHLTLRQKISVLWQRVVAAWQKTVIWFENIFAKIKAKFKRG